MERYGPAEAGHYRRVLVAKIRVPTLGITRRFETHQRS